MHPILFETPRIPLYFLTIPSVPVYTYGVLLAAAYLLGLQFAIVRARSRRIDQNRVMDLGIWIIISALVGAKALLLVTDFDVYWNNPREFMSLVRSAGVFYGGLIAAVSVALFYLWRHRMPMWTVTDCFAPGIALGHVIGRMGCLAAGCCWGRPTDVPWAITFNNPNIDRYGSVGTPQGIPLHPTQIYEAGAELLILVLLLATERKGRPFPGRTFWLYMLLYAISRFIIEIYRGDPRGAVGPFSTSQFISLILAPLSIIMLILLSRRFAPAPAEASRARAA
jgi:phosphatidylglycerol:prolipoprotein diacylglycerol transferase